MAAFVHASIDEVVGVVPQDGLLEKGECFLVEGTLWHSNGFETVAATLHESTQNARMEREQGNAWILSPQRHGDDFMAEGSDAPLDRLDRVMADEFEAKMLGRVLLEKDNTLA